MLYYHLLPSISLLAATLLFNVTQSHLIPPSLTPSYTSTTPSQPTPIPPDLYADLITYSKLIDISYCISPITRIQYPFQCDGDCSKFPHTELIYQWNSNDFTSPLDLVGIREDFSTTGYIAVSHDLRSIVVSLRGTRSFKDSFIDLNADMVCYGEDGSSNMKVHRGFYLSYLHTWEKIKWQLAFQTSKYPSYKLLISGHSMGGAIATFLTLRCAEENLKSDGCFKGITMGQPMVGNHEFAIYFNTVLNLTCDGGIDSRTKFIRVTHKDDPIVHLPVLTDAFQLYQNDITSAEEHNAYHHTLGEVYIDDLGPGVPLISNVYSCIGEHDKNCSYGSKFGAIAGNKEHLNYFKRLGTCGIGFRTLEKLRKGHRN